MKSLRYILTFLFIGCNLALWSQIDKTAAENTGKYYSEKILIGQWKTDEKEEYYIEKSEDGRLQMTNIKVLEWSEIKRSAPNKFIVSKSGERTHVIIFTTSTEMLVEFYGRSNDVQFGQKWTKTAVTIDLSKIKDADTSAADVDHTFIILYPNMSSLYGIYIGKLNKKLNIYLGLRFSQFLNFSQEGGPFESNGEKLSKPSDATASYTGKEEIGQTSVAIGLTNSIIKKRVYIHYGIGYSVTEYYKGFDLWTGDPYKEWNYDRSVWANDIDKKLSGVYTEIGIIADFGVLISVGVGVASFKQADMMFGVGYAF